MANPEKEKPKESLSDPGLTRKECSSLGLIALIGVAATVGLLCKYPGFLNPKWEQQESQHALGTLSIAEQEEIQRALTLVKKYETRIRNETGQDFRFSMSSEGKIILSLPPIPQELVRPTNPGDSQIIDNY